MPITKEEIKEAKLVTEDELRGILNGELRAVVHSIRSEVQSIRSLVEIQSTRIDRCDMVMVEHIKACSESKSSVAELKSILDGIKTGMRITNRVRDAFLWLAGLFVTGLELWKAFH